MLSYMLKHCGSKVGGQTIEGKRGCGRLQSAICVMPVLMQRNVFCIDFCFSKRVMISKCMFQLEVN